MFLERKENINEEEVFNSINELIIRTYEKSDDFLKSLELVEVSYIDLVDGVESNSLEKIILDIINGLKKIKTETERIIIASNLFGVCGEVFIVPFLINIEATKRFKELCCSYK